MLKKMKNNKKKGFTLVELIVVLVILAILAALLIPALTKYIDKAKEKDVIAETRSAVMATQTLVDEAYASKNVGSDDVKFGTDGVTAAAVADLAEVKASNISSTDVVITKGKVTKFVYKKAGKTCTYTNTDSKSNYDVK